MNDMKTGFSRSFGPDARALADAVAHTADDVLHSSQQIAHQTLDQLADRVDDARLYATPVFDRLAHRAEKLKYRSVAAMRDGSRRLRYQAVRATDTTVGYIREKPVKSMLIAAALGAVVVGVLAVFGRYRDHHD
jgi:ElaB/YqjD/DUF883 family membrane-anchored ribosome-binding protein